MSQDNDVVKQIVRWLQADSRRNRMHKYLREQEQYENPFYERRLSEYIETQEQAPANLPPSPAALLYARNLAFLRWRLRTLAYAIQITATVWFVVSAVALTRLLTIDLGTIMRNYGDIPGFTQFYAFESDTMMWLGFTTLIVLYLIALALGHGLFWMAYNLRMRK